MTQKLHQTWHLEGISQQDYISQGCTNLECYQQFKSKTNREESIFTCSWWKGFAWNSGTIFQSYIVWQLTPFCPIIFGCTRFGKRGASLSDPAMPERTVWQGSQKHKDSNDKKNSRLGWLYPTSEFISLLFGRKTLFTTVHPPGPHREAYRSEAWKARHAWALLGNSGQRLWTSSCGFLYSRSVVSCVLVVAFPNNSKTFGKKNGGKPKILHKHNTYVIQGSELACELVQPLLETKVWQCQRLMCWIGKA